jgi:citrate lyase synthetase
MSAINIAGSRLTLKGVDESHQGEGGNLEKLMEGLNRRFPSVDTAVFSFCKRREL